MGCFYLRNFLDSSAGLLQEMLKAMKKMRAILTDEQFKKMKKMMMSMCS